MDDQLTVTTPVVPEALAHLVDEPELAAAWEQQVAARRAEAVKIISLLDYKKRLIADYRHEPGAPVCEVERVAVRDAAQLLGLSEMTTSSILAAANLARTYLPATWAAFQDGLIDMLRVRKIITATEDLDDELLLEVDATAAEQAAARGIADFHRWLTRFIARVDFDAYSRLCARRRTGRYVRFDHDIDGMSFLQARLPTLEAAAIEKRLKITARRQHNTPTANTSDQAQTTSSAQADESAEQPTLAQREADLLSAWLRTGDTPEEGAQPVEAKIMIMIPEPTLTGASEEPAMAADRSWMLDAAQTRTLVANPDADHEWYQGRTRPNRTDADVDVLSATYTGRYPPQRLRDSLIFRDGMCQAANCTVAAERCDFDHQTPWDAGGETTAANLWALCRRHHRLKSHGFLAPPEPESTSRDGPRAPSQGPPVDLFYTEHPISYPA